MCIACMAWSPQLDILDLASGFFTFLLLCANQGGGKLGSPRIKILQQHLSAL